ncbi:CRISPR-associated protein [Nostocales cyanobacterium HT-58-2]|nr:CRISPR-associated protein [Nostocales cyanobacterium HT-58-2]
MTNSFPYLPTAEILHWLAAGQLANRLHRSMRLWVLLNKLYSEEHWASSLPKIFTYAQLRDRLFSPTHSRSDKLSASQVVNSCQDLSCICHKSLQDWVFHTDTYLSKSEWQQAVVQLTGISTTDLEQQLQQYPFATVHRSIREDLKYLTQQGWLVAHSQGQYSCRPFQELPTPPTAISPAPNFAQLSVPQTWELLRVLESISFVQPNLEVVVRDLWEQVTDIATPSHKLKTEPQQRIFIHLDYILSDEMQDRVDTHQEQIEQLWHRPPGGVVQFEYWLASEERKVNVTVYPVCLHYLRRAKYLSAYGIDPQGKIDWHNYRLDRIASPHLQVLAWGDPSVPKPLKELWRTGQLPQPEEVKQHLDTAWGFNFYLKRELLILRFPPAFARWYVDDTVRHPTFQPVDYEQLPKLIATSVLSPVEQKQLLEIIKQRDKNDRYYQAWIRTGDINVLMRLRDWRPNGEVIAPLSVRHRLKEEAIQELSNYQI